MICCLTGEKQNAFQYEEAYVYKTLIYLYKSGWKQ